MTKQFRRRRANMRPLLIYLLIVETRVHCMAVCRMEKQRWKKMQQQQRSKGMKNSYRIKYQSTVYHPIVYRFISLSRFEKLVWLFVFVLLCFLPSLTWTSLVLVAYKSFSLFSALFSPERAIKFNLFIVCVSFIFEEFGRFVVHHSRKEWEHISRPNNIIIISFSNIWLDSHALLKCEVNWNRYLNTRAFQDAIVRKTGFGVLVGRGNCDVHFCAMNLLFAFQQC